MPDTPNFKNPPIVELVLGVQFSPLTKLTSGHFGLFWKSFGDEWWDPSDAAPLEDQFELFDRPRWSRPSGIQVRLQTAPKPGRFLLGNKNGDRLIQLQATRFHFNWRKRADFYPSYKKLIVEFESTFGRFEKCAADLGLGSIIPNQWELTYVDAFPRAEYWQTPGDWSRVLPGLFGNLFPTDDLKLQLENRAAEWCYELGGQLGRLYVSAKSGKWFDQTDDALLLQMTARGPVGKGGVDTLRQGLDLGHNAAFGAFLHVVSKASQDRWGIQS
jgi:uncharacterized protein (TIGR04255 family)